MRKRSKFLKSEDGNVAMMFAASLTALLGITAVGFDYTNMTRLQSQLQAQVDAGVLAAATADVSADDDNDGESDVNDDENGDVDDREKRIRRDAAYGVIKANGFAMTDAIPEMVFKETSVSLKAEIEYEPFFGKILGKEKITLTAEAESGLGELEGLDIVLVLDNTESMSFDGKMTALKEGAISLVDAVEESNSESKIGIVPFARYVRLNDNVRTKSWFQMPTEFDTPRTWQQATHSGGSCSTVTRTGTKDGVEYEYETEECTGQTTTYETKNTTVESRWEGCVGTRTPPYNEQDDAYVHKIPGLINNNPKENTGLNYDIKTWCPAEIVPLSNNYEDLRNQVNSLWPTGYTYIPLGLMWGERILSPGVPFDNKDGAGKRQVMVLMTDGNNTAEIRQDATSAKYYNTPPYIGRVGEDEVATETNLTTARMCEKMKASDIEIYTIAFKVSDPDTKKLLRNCASDPSNSFTADSNISLVNNFKKISKSLKEDVRLMR
jgi:hypothetical protein